MEVLKFLDNNNIEYQKFDHQAVFTVEECKGIKDDIPGAATKNMFLRDKKGRRHFLVALPENKRADLKQLAKDLGIDRLSFGSPERLVKYIGVEPGSVSLLGLITDTENAVEVVLDSEIWNAEAVQCHPMINTSTLAVPQAGLRKFLELTKHQPKVLDVPEVSS